MTEAPIRKFRTTESTDGEIPEDIMEAAREAHSHIGMWDDDEDQRGVEQDILIIARAILHEREQCARLVEVGFTRPGIKTKLDKCHHGISGWEDCEQCAADAIRRGERP